MKCKRNKKGDPKLMKCKRNKKRRPQVNEM